MIGFYRDDLVQELYISRNALLFPIFKESFGKKVISTHSSVVLDRYTRSGR